MSIFRIVCQKRALQIPNVSNVYANPGGPVNLVEVGLVWSARKITGARPLTINASAHNIITMVTSASKRTTARLEFG